MIDVKNISVCKGERNIIDNISCRLEAGNIVALIGKNGAGKSTLLEALTGFSPCCSGSINWDGKDIKQYSFNSLAVRRAVLSQSTEITFPIKVYNLVETGTYVAEEPLGTTKIKSLICNALNDVGLTGFENRDFNTLSGGEKRRVLLAKALVQLNCCHWSDYPKYLFLDEPTAGLDIEQQYKFVDLIKKTVRRRNFGVFAILHDLNIAASFADEILWLRDGKLIAAGTPEKTMRPEIIHKTLDVNAVIQRHPVLNIPYVLTLPETHKTTNKVLATDDKF